MAFFENLSEVLTSKGREAAEAAKKMAEIANLKGQISGVNIEIKKHYAKIGEAYFEKYKEIDIDSEFEESVQAIRDAKNAIEALEKRLKALKGTAECQSCGNPIDVQYTFCPKCGEKVAEDFFDEEDDFEDAEVQIIEETVIEEEEIPIAVEATEAEE
ncbi:MAG: hypothetical protein IKW28_03305 [Lachnospiraceae bacterium]|nr:hypothetical protein [Lachnospiraceae bacterium]